MAEAATPPMSATASPKGGLWSPLHASVLEDLFGEGYVAPAGDGQIDNLAGSIALSEDQSILLIGAGTGGLSLALARQFGVSVSGFEAVEAFLQLARQRVERAGLAGRISIEPWSAAAPALKPQSCDHAVALLPLGGALPETVLSTIGTAIRAGGHCVLLELVAMPPCDPRDSRLRAWLKADLRATPPPEEQQLAEIMDRLGFDICLVEDVTQRYLQQTMAAWRGMLARLKGRPTRPRAAVMLAEAERWMLCADLMRSRRLRLMRWHAVQDGERRVDVGAIKLEIMLSVQFRDWPAAILHWEKLALLHGDTAETRDLRAFIKDGIARDRSALAPEIRAF